MPAGKVDPSFGGSAQTVGPIPVLKALSEVWQVVGSFCFFVVRSKESIVEGSVHVS
jgi:hypothetical protein